MKSLLKVAHGGIGGCKMNQKLQRGAKVGQGRGNQGTHCTVGWAHNGPCFWPSSIRSLGKARENGLDGGTTATSNFVA